MRISDWSSDVCSSDLHAHGRAHRLAREELQEVWHALAADLLVVGEAEMDRCREIVLEEARRMGQRHRDEGLHIRGAAAVEAAAVLAHQPGNARPRPAERRGGKGGGRTCRYRWSADH